MSINHYLSSLDKQHQEELDSWKIEKEQRIKPSLWWSDVVTAQQAQTDSTTEPVLSTLQADGKVWYLHPVGMMGFVNISIVRNYTINDAKKALRIIYNQYDKEMAITIERMYRDETAHFTSLQYKYCGASGMVSFGDVLDYGWDGQLFTQKPIGTWLSFENKGMS